jgi:hypothetical protein
MAGVCIANAGFALARCPCRNPASSVDVSWRQRIGPITAQAMRAPELPVGWVR